MGYPLFLSMEVLKRGKLMGGMGFEMDCLGVWEGKSPR